MRRKTHLRKPYTPAWATHALCGRYVDADQIVADRPTCRQCRRATK